MRLAGGKRIASKLAAPVKQLRRAILRAIDSHVCPTARQSAKPPIQPPPVPARGFVREAT